jgi:hypothetical protein
VPLPSPEELGVTCAKPAAAAEADWAAAGAGGAALATLSTLDVRIADLPDTLLGVETAGVVWIDVDAAGHGWFIDPDPAAPVPAGRAAAMPRTAAAARRSSTPSSRT